MTKRIVALLIAVLFVASCSMLTACTGGDNTTDAQKPTEKPSQSSAQPTESVQPTQSAQPTDSAEPTPTPTPTPSEAFDPGEEPDRAADESAWVEWLINIYDNDFDYADTLSDLGYPYLEGGVSYDSMKADGCQDSSAWETWGGAYQMCYQFDKTEWDGTASINTEDYAYDVEIFYRPVDDDYVPQGDGKFQKVSCAPWSCYVWGGDNPRVIYRFKAYDAGMRLSMAKDDAGNDIPQEYEFIFLISYKESGDIIGWNQYYSACTDSTMAFLQKAIDEGIVTPD